MNVFKQKLILLLFVCWGFPLLLMSQNTTTTQIFQGQQYEDFVNSVLLPANITRPPTNGAAYWLETNESLGQIGFNTLVYEPNAGFVGTDTIEIAFWRPPFSKVENTIIIEVKKSSVVAIDDQSITTLGQPVAIDVLSNDTNTNGTLSVKEVLVANNAASTNINPNGTIVFTPTDGFSGVAYLEYLVCNDIDVCDNATVIINVEHGNTPTSDTLSIYTTKLAAIALATSLDGFTLQNNPTKGWIDDSNDVAEYVPNGTDIGADQLIYTAPNGATKIINIEIFDAVAENIYAKDDYAYTPVDEAVEIAFLENDASAIDFASVQITSQPRFGTLSETANGLVTYTPRAGFVTQFYEYTVDRFTYQVTHTDGTTETATVYVYVNDFYPSASTFELNVPKNSPLAIQYAAPINYDRFEVVSQGGAGTVEFFQTVDKEVYGQQVVGEKVLLYTPNQGVTGYDEFEVQYCVTTGTEKCRSIKLKVNILDVEVAATEKCILNDCVWEGDINNDGAVNMQDVLALGYHVGKTGAKRTTNATSDEWYGKGGSDWEEEGLKHADANGDGVVSAKDTAAVSTYFGNTHKITPAAIPATDALPIYYGKPDTIPVYGPGDIIEFPIILGNEYYPVKDIYGLTFSINYSPSTFVVGSGRIKFKEDSWLGYGSSILELSKEVFEGKIEAAATRTNNRLANGYGQVALFTTGTVEDVYTWRIGEEEINASITITASAINGAGETVTLGTEVFDFKIDLTREATVEEEVLDENFELNAFPNPAHDVVGLNVGAAQLERVEVFSFTGQKVLEAQNINQLQVRDWAAGMYFIKAYTTTGEQFTTKFEVVK